MANVFTTGSPLKVVHVIVGLEIGGAEMSLFRLLQAHAEDRTIEHRVLSLTSEGALGPRLREAGITVNAMGMDGAASMLSATTRLFKVLREHNPHVVQTWMYHADILGGIAARFTTSAAVAWNVRGTKLPGGRLTATGALAILAGILSRVIPDRIICVAEAARKEHIALGYAARKIEVIQNGIDTAKFAVADARPAARVRLGLPQTDRIIGFVGRFDPLKDIPTLARAVSIVRRRMPEARLLMIGRGMDRSFAPLAQILDGVGLLESTCLLGESDDIRWALAAMDVFCLSSSSEGFPNALAEAMAAAVPVVTTDAGDARDMVEPHARVVPVGAAGQLADALLETLAMSPSEREAMGASLRARVEARYSIARVAQRYRALYEELAVAARRS